MRNRDIRPQTFVKLKDSVKVKQIVNNSFDFEGLDRRLQIHGNSGMQKPRLLNFKRSHGWLFILLYIPSNHNASVPVFFFSLRVC